jgi:hypothetical protein
MSRASKGAVIERAGRDGLTYRMFPSRPLRGPEAA